MLKSVLIMTLHLQKFHHVFVNIDFMKIGVKLTMLKVFLVVYISYYTTSLFLKTNVVYWISTSVFITDVNIDILFLVNNFLNI